jgi:hypothetical protein
MDVILGFDNAGGPMSKFVIAAVTTPLVSVGPPNFFLRLILRCRWLSGYQGHRLHA